VRFFCKNDVKKIDERQVRFYFLAKKKEEKKRGLISRKKNLKKWGRKMGE